MLMERGLTQRITGICLTERFWVYPNHTKLVKCTYFGAWDLAEEAAGEKFRRRKKLLDTLRLLTELQQKCFAGKNLRINFQLEV